MAGSHSPRGGTTGESLGRHRDTNAAVLLLIASTPEASFDKLNSAIEQAFTDAQRSLDENLRLARLPVLEGRQAELRAHKDRSGPPLSPRRGCSYSRIWTPTRSASYKPHTRNC